MDKVKAHELFHQVDIDFKIANTSSSSSDSIVMKETGFDGLSVRVCKELVTLGPLAEATSLANTGTHLTPREFHQALLDASSSTCSTSAILLDARNLYETRLGRFQVDGVPTIDPKTRAFADLPAFIISNRDMLRDKSIFMYCTGGVRCERSSAFLAEMVPGVKVFQLRGGIQRYLESYGGDEGLFTGKNFVYDERIGVASALGKEVVVGRCLACSQPWDSYSSRTRCLACRMLVLVCNSCLDSRKNGGSDAECYFCEICQEKKRMDRVKLQQPRMDGQNPFPSPASSSPRSESGITRLKDGCASISKDKPKLKVLCLHGFRQTAGSFLGRTIGLRRRLDQDIDWYFIDAPHILPHTDTSLISSPLPPASARRCWLLDDLSEVERDSSSKALNQTLGLTESLSRIQDFAEAYGPFDGVLGFSQGSAMATNLCQLQQEGRLGFSFRFAILASGYQAKLPSSSSFGPICLPSLHIFGGVRDANEPGQAVDQQVPASESEVLLEAFDYGQRLVYRHGQGHLIPCNKQCVGVFQSFLKAQVLEETS